MSKLIHIGNSPTQAEIGKATDDATAGQYVDSMTPGMDEIQPKMTLKEYLDMKMEQLRRIGDG